MNKQSKEMAKLAFAMSSPISSFAFANKYKE